MFGVISDKSPTSLQVVKHTAFGCISQLFLAITRTSSHNHFQLHKNGRSRPIAGFRLSIFKGREAKLNRVILLVLFQSGPLVVYDITKEITKYRAFRKTKYTNVNRRVRALAEQGYLETVGSRETQSGSRGALYQPTIRATVAFYQNKISRDQFVREANDDALTTELAALALFLGKDHF
jgi:DNA-binding PadR family transcriptional regulator